MILSPLLPLFLLVPLPLHHTWIRSLSMSPLTSKCLLCHNSKIELYFNKIKYNKIKPMLTHKNCENETSKRKKRSKIIH